MDNDKPNMYSIYPDLPYYEMYQSFGDEGDNYTLYTDKIPNAKSRYGTYHDQMAPEAETELEAIEHHIQELTGLVNYSGKSPEWVKKRVSKAASLISEVANYLHGEVGEAQDMHMSEYLLRSEEQDFESLEKSAQYKQMLGGNIEPHREAYDTAKKMPNSNWGTWVIRNYRANPEKFHEIKHELEHFAGSQHIPEVSQVRFDKGHSFESGLDHLKSAEKAYNDRIGQKTNLVVPTSDTKKILDVGNGMAWYSLGKGSCSAEGKAMGHCGNVPSEAPYHEVLSLRSAHKMGGKTYHEPHLTFINDKENNVLGEMKGRANEKPNPRYHEAISHLLAQGYVPMGGGYAHENNFHIDDLSPEHRAHVLKNNPEAFAMSSDPELSAQALEKLL
jgi:hypothetical protein